MEKVGNIPKMKHLNLPDDAEIAINCAGASGMAATADLRRRVGRLRLGASRGFATDQVRHRDRRDLEQAGSAGVREVRGSSIVAKPDSGRMIAGLYLGEVRCPSLA